MPALRRLAERREKVNAIDKGGQPHVFEVGDTPGEFEGPLVMKRLGRGY